MREILFRGKRTDNGEWIEGFYSAEEYNLNIRKIEYIPRIQIIGKCVSLGVLPETVGQFTGLTDKNGKKIFEWDIVKRGDRIWIIEYDVKYAQFVMKTFTERGVFWIRSFDLIPSEWCEVIGNKFDNPELIKGGEKNGKNDVKGRTRQ